MSAAERLLREATKLLNNHEHIPVDLATKLLAEGIDVTTIERKHN